MSNLLSALEKHTARVAVEMAEYEGSLSRLDCKDLLDEQGLHVRSWLLYRTSNSFSDIDIDTKELGFGIELIQQSTLIVDDCLDHSLVRHGHPSAFQTMGFEKAVSIGQILLSDGFRFIANALVGMELSNAGEILSEVSSVHRDIYIGQYLDLLSERDVNLSEQQALEIIWHTTARFIQCPVVIGAMIARISDDVLQVLRDFGIYLGVAYQLRDDVLDITAASSCTGKPECGDLRECKMRVPLISALRNASVRERQWAVSKLNQGKLDPEDTEDMRQFVGRFGGIDYCIDKAKEFGDLALNALGKLPPSMKEFSVEMRELTDIIATFDFSDKK